MTPKEKAKQLLDSVIMLTKTPITKQDAKQLAVIGVDFMSEFSDDSERSCYGYRNTNEYLQAVKAEIQLL